MPGIHKVYNSIQEMWYFVEKEGGKQMRIRRILDVIIITLFLSFVLFATYNALGKPLTLHHAMTRIFKDRVNEYSIKNRMLIISADEMGWDGSQWTADEAIAEGRRDIFSAFQAVREYDPSIKSVQITVTYLKQPLFTESAMVNQ